MVQNNVIKTVLIHYISFALIYIFSNLIIKNAFTAFYNVNKVLSYYRRFILNLNGC